MGAGATAFDHPFQNAGVLAVAGPEELALGAFSEPVHMKNAGHIFDEFPHLEPVSEVVAHVVTAEGQHRHRVAAHLAERAGGGSGHLGSHRGTEIDAVRPVEGLENERHRRGAASAENDRADWHAGGVFPLGVDHRAIPRWRGEAAVRVAGENGFAVLVGLAWLPIPAVPVDEMRGRLLGHSFPPDIAVVGEGDIGENGVAFDRVHGDRVARIRGAGGDAEKARLGVDGSEKSVRAGLDPGDVVTHAGDLPALFFNRVRRDHHGEVRLAAGTRERGGDIGFLAVGRLHAEHKHVFGHPTLVARHGGGDAQGEAFFAKQGVAAVTRAEAHNQTLLGEVRDVGLGRVAGPGDILLARLERASDRVQAFHKDAGFFDLGVNFEAHARHDFHVRDDIRAVGEFDAVLGDRRADRPHAEGNYEQRASSHAAFEQALEAGFHLVRGFPVVRRAGVFFRLRADEGPLLHAGDIARIAADEQGVRALVGVQPLTGAGGDDRLAHGLVLSLGAVAPEDLLGACESGEFLDPGEDGGVIRFRRAGVRNGFVFHDGLSFHLSK